jgi:hypothetical protein
MDVVEGRCESGIKVGNKLTPEKTAYDGLSKNSPRIMAIPLQKAILGFGERGWALILFFTYFCKLIEN